jgi:hypothetical protein
MEMPAVNLEILKTVLSVNDMDIVSKVVAKRGGVNRLRASKPADGPAAYVWRMVAFIVSPHSQHHCMPVGADFYVNKTDYAHRTDKFVWSCETQNDKDYVANLTPDRIAMMNNSECRRQYMKQELDPIVDKIIDTIPKEQWRGAQRWKQAIYG